MKRAAITVSIALAALSATSAQAGESAKEQANKKTVIAFYEAGLNRLDYDAAAKYLGPVYRQHNPTAQEGAEGFRGFVSFLKDKFPMTHSEIVRSFADGDYVILHGHSRPWPLPSMAAQGRSVLRACGLYRRRRQPMCGGYGWPRGRSIDMG